jgi:hypothetical protein
MDRPDSYSAANYVARISEHNVDPFVSFFLLDILRRQLELLIFVRRSSRLQFSGKMPMR